MKMSHAEVFRYLDHAGPSTERQVMLALRLPLSTVHSTLCDLKELNLVAWDTQRWLVRD
jgi:DNA-binding IclR family transcriptional regulator